MSRILKNIEEKRQFYILTNGEKTEMNYFKLLKSKKSIYEVSVKFFNDDPSQLVQHALQYIENANQIWCVFDVDNCNSEGSLIPAINIANNNGINIAFSNLSFEVWLISHYKKCENWMDITKGQQELNKILSEITKNEQSYDKSSKKQLEKYFIPKVKKAIEYSKIVHQSWIKKHKSVFYNNQNYPIWNWNSCSTVYQLVEALELKELDK